MTSLHPSIPPGAVVAVSRRADHGGPKHPCASIELLAGIGVVGDAHAGRTVQHQAALRRDPTQPNRRQIYLIPSELHTILQAAGFAVGPGVMGENITTTGIDLVALPLGTQLHLGSHAVIEVTGLRNPCRHLETIQPGLMAAVLGRDQGGRLLPKAGVMGIVLVGGPVAPAMTITIALPAAPHTPLPSI